jgi:hypothetical protein
MICPNCKKHIENNLNYCNYCGEKISNINKTSDHLENHSTQYSYNEMYSNITSYHITSDEDYVKAYVGKNYESVKNESFSLPALILGPIYLLYKNLIKYGLLILLIYLLLWYYTNYNITVLFVITINLILGFKFNKIYLEYSQRRTEEIKLSNPDKTSLELLEVCKIKGKSNSIINLILLIIFIILLISVYIDNYGTNLINNQEQIHEEEEHNNEYITELNKEYELIYTVPNEFTNETLNTTNYKFYNYTKNNISCYLTITKYEDMTNYNEETYIKKRIMTSDEQNTLSIKTKKINNYTWYTITRDNSYTNKNFYVIKENDIIYKIEYTNNQNSEVCTTYENEIINSLNFKELD